MNKYKLRKYCHMIFVSFFLRVDIWHGTAYDNMTTPHI